MKKRCLETLDLPKVSLNNYRKEVFPCSCCSWVLVSDCKVPRDNSIVILSCINKI